jgi:integrase
MLLKGVPAKVVSEILGHASIAITLDLYSHVLPDMQEQAVAAMESVFAERKSRRPS